MKRTIRILSVCLAFSLLCATCLYAAPTSSDGNIADKMSDAISEIESPLTISKERLENERAALIQYNDLIKGMQSITKSEDVYLESYGGAYIDDNGDLVVCITESSDRASATEMVKTLTKKPDVETKVVKYSLNHLYQAYSEVSDTLNTVIVQKKYSLEKKHIYFNTINDISATFIDEVNNVLVVEIHELTEQKINRFKKAFPSIDCVVFDEGGVNSTTATQWHPGRAIYTPDGDMASTGYPVWFTDSNGAVKRGFITAGHSFHELCDDNYYAYKVPVASASNLFAQKVRSQFFGTVDAALMEIIDSNYEMSATTCYEGATLVTNSYAVVPVGASVIKEGGKSYSTSGTVLSTSCSANYGFSVVSDLIFTSAYNGPGDSGGVMYSAGTMGIIGSMSGSKKIDENADLTPENFVRSNVCKVANATNVLNCTVWNY